MTAKQNLEQYVAYNLWANQTIVAYVSRCSDTQFEQDNGSSFPSLRKTILHICDAEVLWMNRLEGVSLSQFPSANFNGSNAEMLSMLVAASTDFLTKVCALTAKTLETKLTYTTISYGQTSQTQYNMVHHCMNHSTFHRGQIITFLRQLGFTDLPHLDFMLYLMNNKANH